MRPEVTFVVPVRNDAERLRTCLAAIQAAARDVPHEVLVLDHASTDASVAVATAAGARVLTRSGGHVASMRNLGASDAQARLVAFVDADNEIAPTWLSAGLAALEDPAVGAAGSAYHAPPHGTWVQRTYDTLRRHPATIGPTEWLGAGNMLVRRDVFHALGGFDDALETCEDVDLSMRFTRARWRLLDVPAMRSVHHGDPTTLGQVFRGERWRGRDNIRVTLRGPKTLRSVVSALIPVAWVGLTAAAVLGAFWGGWQGPLLAGIALVALATLVAVRVLAMRANAGGAWPEGLGAAVAVAATYDAARAAAVVAGGGHGRRQRV